MLRVGADLVRCDRVARAVDRWGNRFLGRLFTPEEVRDCAGRVESLAARVAAKEAAAKALGVGLAAGVSWSDIEVWRDSRGGPHLRLHGRAARLAHEGGLAEWSVSLTHEGGLALAVVVAGPGREHDADG